MRLRPCLVHGLDGSSRSKALSSQGPGAFFFSRAVTPLTVTGGNTDRLIPLIVARFAHCPAHYAASRTLPPMHHDRQFPTVSGVRSGRLPSTLAADVLLDLTIMLRPIADGTRLDDDSIGAVAKASSLNAAPRCELHEPTERVGGHRDAAQLVRVEGNCFASRTKSDIQACSH
jgi:hypothetical protein